MEQTKHKALPSFRWMDKHLLEAHASGKLKKYLDYVHCLVETLSGFFVFEEKKE